MKRLSFIAALMVVLLVAASCGKKSNEQAKNQEQNANTTQTASQNAPSPPPPASTTTENADKERAEAAAKAEADQKAAAEKSAAGQSAAEQKRMPQEQQKAAAAPPPAPKPVTLVVPAQTPLTVRIDQPISTKTSKEGDPFTATLSQPVRVHNEVAIPAGARVHGTITEAKSAGKMKGDAVLSLRLDALEANGHTYPISTASAGETKKGRGKRSAIATGGGAGAGALIGGIAGGGKGLAIGALVGGATGAVGSAATGKRDIELPAEAALTFNLAQPVSVTIKQTAQHTQQPQANTAPPQSAAPTPVQ